MKLVKFIFCMFIFAIIAQSVFTSETSTSSKTKMKMQSLEKLYNDYLNFNKKAESYKNGIYLVFNNFKDQ
jgi:hypothetical protein